jgi:hypothetical protein
MIDAWQDLNNEWSRYDGWNENPREDKIEAWAWRTIRDVQYYVAST